MGISKTNANLQMVLKNHITEEVSMKLQKESIRTVGDIVLYDASELSDMLRLTYFTAGNILQVIYQYLLPHDQRTAKAKYEAEKPRPVVRLPGIGDLLTLKAGCLTEFAGCAGAGKTQLCFSVTAEVAKTRIVVWIDTEKTFSPDRLAQVVKSREGDQFDFQKLLANVQVVRVSNLRDMKQRVREIERDKTDIGCVIIDSLADLARKERHKDNRDNTAALSVELTKLAADLKQIATRRGLLAVVTNQVYGGNNSNGGNVNKYVTAALGVAWHHAVNTRIMLTMVNRGEYHPPTRTLNITKAAWQPPTSFRYVIDAGGVSIEPEHLVPLQQ